MTSTKIEALWSLLQASGASAQQRIAGDHPCDLYADYQAGGHVGIVAVSDVRPRPPTPLNSMQIEVGQRSDGRYTLRLSLQRASLRPIFAALCDDIIVSTGTGSAGHDCAAMMSDRLQRWRKLLERDQAGLSASELLGLIGELTVLEHRFLPLIGAKQALHAWTGPAGASHDFLLPDGSRAEVKTVAWQAATARINGLAQLDTSAGPIMLVVVRTQHVGPEARDHVTAPLLVARLRAVLGSCPDAIDRFDDALLAAGWHEHPSHDEVRLRVVRIDAHAVGDNLPRLTADLVPAGVSEVAYDTLLPTTGFDTWLSAL